MPEPNGRKPAESEALDSELRRDLDRGLEFANVMLTVVQDTSMEAGAYGQALFELLVRKGILGEEEVKEALEASRKDIAEVLVPRVRLADLGDKHADAKGIDVDCASLLPLCHARCCTFKFYLTKQDLDEGVARWDYGNPYWIRQGDDSYCVHCDPSTRGCTIYADRPHVCRRFDCRQDKRIWLDFEKRVVAPPPPPSIVEAPVAMAEVVLRNSIRAAQQDDEETPD